MVKKRKNNTKKKRNGKQFNGKAGKARQKEGKIDQTIFNFSRRSSQVNADKNWLSQRRIDVHS